MARNSWNTIVYNFRWSDWVGYINGWIPKFALFVPIIGYLILFNDKVSDILVFNTLANESVLETGLKASLRLRCLYFGLILLGVSNFVYILRKPNHFRLGDNLVKYTRTCLDIFTLSDYIQMHGTIRSEGHLTLAGKYYDSEWDGFLEAAKNSGEGTDEVKRSGNWENAKSQYGSLLREILSENFFRYDTKKRLSLSVCIALSTLGYFLLIIPSIDIFIKVLRSTIGF